MRMTTGVRIADTDEENLKGVIDFNNNTGFVNERRIWGATFRYNFGSL